MKVVLICEDEFDNIEKKWYEKLMETLKGETFSEKLDWLNGILLDYNRLDDIENRYNDLTNDVCGDYGCKRLYNEL